MLYFENRRQQIFCALGWWGRSSVEETAHSGYTAGGGGRTLAAASFVLLAILSRGLVTLDTCTQRLHGGGTLAAASFVLLAILSRGLVTFDAQLLHLDDRAYRLLRLGID